QKTYVTIFFVGILTFLFLTTTLWPNQVYVIQEQYCIGPWEISYDNKQCDDECTSQQYAYGYCDYQIKGEDNPQCCCNTW
ncbi:unnamed protein product, partial [Arabidopsis halleri]